MHLSDEWREGERYALDGLVPICLYPDGSRQAHDWWGGFKACTHAKAYDFTSGQLMTQKQFETEMDAITHHGHERRNGKDRRSYRTDMEIEAIGDERRASGLPLRRGVLSGKIGDRRKTATIAPPMAQPASERQEGGTHYRDMKIQPFEYVTANGLGFGEGLAIRYLSRWRKKDGIKDLRKAIHCIELLIEHETKKD